jgi:hypothetical protein
MIQDEPIDKHHFEQLKNRKFPRDIFNFNKKLISSIIEKKRIFYDLKLQDKFVELFLQFKTQRITLGHEDIGKKLRKNGQQSRRDSLNGMLVYYLFELIMTMCSVTSSICNIYEICEGDTEDIQYMKRDKKQTAFVCFMKVIVHLCQYLYDNKLFEKIEDDTHLNNKYYITCKSILKKCKDIQKENLELASIDHKSFYHHLDKTRKYMGAMQLSLRNPIYHNIHYGSQGGMYRISEAGRRIYITKIIDTL